MSIQAVGDVLETEINEVSAKMLLISLANAHNTATGLCCPSIERLCRETGMGRSTVKRWMRWLEMRKYVQLIPIHTDSGRQQANQYKLTLREGSNLDPSEGSNLDRAQFGLGVNSEPVEGSSCGPLGGSACEPPLKEPEEYRKKNRKKDTRTPHGELVAVLDVEHANAVVEHRQRIRKPLTAHAAKLLAEKFAACPDPNAAADVMISNGWQGFEPSWMERQQYPRGAPPGQQPPQRYDPFKALAERLSHEPDRSHESDDHHRENAQGVPLITIDHDRR